MKKSSKRKINLALSVVFVVQVAGVAFIMIFNAVHERRHHRDLLATDALTLQFTGPGNIELQDPHAYARKGGLLVSGCLNRRAPAAGPVTSQVDIKLLSPKANVLDQTTIRDLSRCKRGGVHFSTRFSVVPSDGSVLAVTALADQEDVSKRGPASPGPCNRADGEVSARRFAGRHAHQNRDSPAAGSGVAASPIGPVRASGASPLPTSHEDHWPEVQTATQTREETSLRRIPLLRERGASYVSSVFAS